MKLFLAAIAIFAFAGLTFANSVPTRGRSDYGNAPSTILATGSQSADGVSIDSEEFCPASLTSSDIGTCALAFAFQITSTLPDGQSLTFTFPLPAGATSPTVGLLTNDGAFAGANLFFSPFSQSDVLALAGSAIQTGTDGSGNPFLTFALPITLTGAGTNLAFFLDISDSNSINNDGQYCYKLADPGVDGCTAIDTPGIPALGIDLKTSTVGAPEPASLALLASGLFALGFVRRGRKAN